MAITYNLAAVDSLVLDAPTLAKIFNGTITRWDDPALTSLNASMPAEDIKRHLPQRRIRHHLQLPVLPAGRIRRSVDPRRGQDLQRRRRHRRPRQQGHLGAGEDHRGRDQLQRIVIRARSKGCTPPRSRPRRAAGRYARFASAPTRSARPSKAPKSPAPATTSCSTFRRSTTRPSLTSTRSCWPPTRSSARNTRTPRTAQAVKSFLQAAIGPGQIDLNKAGYIPLSPELPSPSLKRRRRHQLCSRHRTG